MLNQSRENSERLHRESELVVSNVNQWVSEQKSVSRRFMSKIFVFKHKNQYLRNNSEKLAVKIREQAAAIVQINNEKYRLVQDNEIYQQQIKKLSQELESSNTDKDKIEVIWFS